ncbi:MAG: exonuclease SbcCD subunit D [Eubacteriales bacterium]
MIKILHTGDLHLDSPFVGVDLPTGERLRSELRRIFTNIVELAAEHDMLLIAGDLFDCGFVSPDTLALVRDRLADYAKPVVIAPGNHDPYSPGSIWAAVSWSENVMIFDRQELSTFRFNIGDTPVSVHGWAFASSALERSPLADGLVPDRGAVNIICAHADTASPISKYAPTPLSLFAASGCEYAALGHIHNAPDIAVAGNTTVAYCGFPEGRSFDEEGDGSVLSVTLEDGKMPAVSRITTSTHKYLTRHLDVTGCETDRDIADKLISLASAEAWDGNVSLKVYLEGSIPPDYSPNFAQIEALAALPLCSLQLRNRTSPVFGAEYLANDLTIKGELYRTLLPRLSSPDEAERTLAADALRIGLLALDGRAFL